jgi:hypothetical protein
MWPRIWNFSALVCCKDVSTWYKDRPATLLSNNVTFMEECFVSNLKYIFMEIVINFDERWIEAQPQENTIAFLVQQSRFTAAKKDSRRVPVSFHYGRALAVQGRAAGWTGGSDSRLGQKIVLFCRVSRPAQPASYPLVTGGSFPEGKAAGSWNWPLVSI